MTLGAKTPVRGILLVVDVQNGFVSEATSHVVGEIRDLIQEHEFDQVVFTRYINKEGGPYTRFLNWKRLMAPPETDIVSELRPFAKTVIEKCVYTAWGAELAALIREHSTSTVYIAGIDTDCCVLTSATDLFQQGIKPMVLLNYCASNGGPRSHDAAAVVLTRLIGDAQILRGKFQ